jgi:hypothetical protein
MIVFGDVTRPMTVGDKACVIQNLLRQVAEAPDALLSDRARAAFIELSELVVALEDAGLPTRTLMPRLWQLGRIIGCAWGRTPFKRGLQPDDVAVPPAVADLRMPFRVSEGYAFYAVYPEAYLEAARALAGHATQVIGLRSIGLSLGVMVALGAGTREFTSVRPYGAPFDRRVDLPPSWRVDPDTQVAIVDEGPGLSGSSFSAAVAAVESRGIAPSGVHLFPSHPHPPGDMASELIRTRWPRLRKHHVAFDELWLKGDNHSRMMQAALALGIEGRSIRDLSAGAWRHVGDRGLAAAPAHPARENRKFLYDAGGRHVLAKFAGLGTLADEKFQRAKWLAEGGWSPPVIGLRDGFLFQPWLRDTCDVEQSGISQPDLVTHVARYLAARQKMLAPCNSGADPLTLAQMARHNIKEGLGVDAIAAFEPILASAKALQSSWTPMATDNRLHSCEWRCSNGRLWKLDAVDHCCSHDLIGCQDMLWDVAGALVEFDLPTSTCEDLMSHLPLSKSAQKKEGLLFALICYCAFQLGLWHASAQDSSAISERLLVQKYTRRLRSIAHSIDD